MAWRIVKQPSGKFARFSEVVDNFTHHGMTGPEAYRLCRHDMGVNDSMTKVKNAELYPERWDEALKIIATVHGNTERDKVLSEMGERVEEKH